MSPPPPPPPPPIDAAEFDAHKDLSAIITQFLCRNRDKGFSAKEIAQATGIAESSVSSAMLKMGLADIVGSLTRPARGKGRFRIDDVTIDGTVYYRCVSVDRAEK